MNSSLNPNLSRSSLSTSSALLTTCDHLVIGGGVIGLSVAYELAKRGEQVQIIDQGRLGQEASWAGVGILPPANRTTATHPLEQLHGLSCELHPQWADTLQQETGIDPGYHRCGGLYFAFSAGEAAALVAWRLWLAEREIPCEEVDAQKLQELEPGLASLADSSQLRRCYRLPGEAQLRSPRYVAALIAACRNRGVTMIENVAAQSFSMKNRRVTHVNTSAGTISPKMVCVTSGAWTRQLLQTLQIPCDIFPVRGQVVMYRCPRPPFTHILNEGSRYLTPRDDGRILVGSTEEEVGFDKSTTEEAIDDLKAFALRLAPFLKETPVERVWSGLRPASFDGFPYIGAIPQIENAFVAAGHFRAGFILAPATGAVIAQIMCEEKPAIDLSPFRVGR